MSDIFSPFGLLSKNLPSFTYRESQEDMASLIEKALREKRHVILEAGTGIGKSYAYLAPCIEYLISNVDKRVVISTPTTTLQKQLYSKDLPFLLKLFNSDKRCAILYGRTNYLCLAKYYSNEAYYHSGQLQDSDKRLKEWVENTSSGSKLDIIDIDVKRKVDHLLCDKDECRGPFCPYYEKCFYYKAKKNAETSSIIVTNHALVFSDAEIRWENHEDYSTSVILPPYQILVLDEAHKIEDEATEAFSSIYSYLELKSKVEKFTKKQSTYSNMNILEYLSPHERKEKKGIGIETLKGLDSVLALGKSFDEALSSSLSSFSSDNQVLLTPEFFKKFLSSFKGKGELLSRNISLILNELNNSYVVEEGMEYINDVLVKLNQYSEELYSLASSLLMFLRFNNYDEAIPYSRKTQLENYELIIAPMEVSSLLRDRIINRLETIVFCSATLSVDGKFNYIRSKLGLENFPVLEGIFPSPFNYEKNLLYLLPMDGMEYKKSNDDYAQYLADNISSALLSSGGGALILFTSFTMMNEVYSRVKKNIGKQLDLLIQNSNMSKNQLLTNFKNNNDSSLFATSSFWEGVDAPGETLRMVIITQLPFMVPSDPITKARGDYITRMSNANAFLSSSFPIATIRLKQGVGRLIRMESDRGIILILDARIIKKNYGKTMLSSLPPGYYPEDCTLDNIPKKIEEFLY